MKETRAGRPIIVGEITIIPLERLSVYHDGRKGGLLIYASKEPIGIVIVSPQGTAAIDMCGGQVPLENYIRDIHGLQQLLDSL